MKQNQQAMYDYPDLSDYHSYDDFREDFYCEGEDFNYDDYARDVKNEVDVVKVKYNSDGDATGAYIENKHYLEG